MHISFQDTNVCLFKYEVLVLTAWIDCGKVSNWSVVCTRHSPKTLIVAMVLPWRYEVVKPLHRWKKRTVSFDVIVWH